MRCLGMPVVPPVSKMLNGLPLNCAGTQTSGWRSRSDSSAKCGNFSMSAKELISLRGSKFFFAQSSQYGQPVPGLKCQWMISLRCASSWACAALVASGETVVIAKFAIYELRFTDRLPSRGLDLHLRHFVPGGLVRVGEGVEVALVQDVHHAV